MIPVGMRASKEPAAQMFVPFAPVAQPRHRVAARGRRAIAYIPKEHPIHEFKQAVRRLGRSLGIRPLDCPVEVEMEFVFERTSGNTYKTKPMHREPKATDPDIDNLEKAIYDALQGVWWVVDSRIWRHATAKVYRSGDEIPGVHIRAWVTV